MPDPFGTLYALLAGLNRGQALTRTAPGKVVTLPDFPLAPPRTLAYSTAHAGTAKLGVPGPPVGP